MNSSQFATQRRRRGRFLPHWQLAIVHFSFAAATVRAAPAAAVSVDLRLLTGGGISGLVVDHTDFGLVVVHENTPYVFAWEEVEGGSAFRAKRDLLALDRGGTENLTAEDHFQLGAYAISRDLTGAALRAFKEAEKLDPSFAPRVAEAKSARRGAAAVEPARPALDPVAAAPLTDDPPKTPLGDLVEAAPVNALSAGALTDAQRAEVRALYDRFGAMVVQEMGPGVSLLETPHFLIWSDADPSARQRIGGWCEAMYTALCGEFGLDATTDVFLAKCPIFCWKNKARFQRFARVFDAHDGRDAVGYTRSIERNGHVHMVLYLHGRSPADLDAFASTLVHEGTHAFVHRFRSSRLIPHWVHEGLAELTAERVLGDRCPAGEKAALLAAQYVRHEWPVRHVLGSVGPIPVHEYALATSVVTYLDSFGRERFTRFMVLLKAGRSVAEALAEAYDGMDLDALEVDWRAWAKEGMAKGNAGEGH